MMKFVFALVVLLHLCYGYKLNMTLNVEIIGRLETLKSLHKARNGSITLPDTRYMLTTYMRRNASSCVSHFVRELQHVLDNVTVHEASEHVLQELKENLRVLDPHQQIDHNCQMTKSKNMKPFNPYLSFLKILNSSTKR